VQRRALALLWLLAAAVAGCGSGAPVAGPVDPAWRLSVRGMTYVGYSADVFCSPASDRLLALLPALHVNTLALGPVWYQPRADAVAIAPWPGVSPSDACVRHAIAAARGLGLRVVLKPFLDVRDGTWRARIAPRDWPAWFRAYTAFIDHYAVLAQQAGVWALVVGTELSSSDVTHADAWRQVIASVRRRFAGPLTYAADWPQYRSVPFWDDLDWVGVDAYFPLSTSPAPTRDELVLAWQPWLRQISAWSPPKPVLFTEIGYRSEQGAAADPAVFHRQAPVDLRLQADAVAAAFQALTPQSWLLGTLWFWWDNPSTADAGGGPQDNGYTPRGKPAEAVLAAWYARWAAMRR
jgi:hypothetical protein